MNYSFSVGGRRPFFTSRLQHACKHSMRKLASFLLLSLALATALPTHSATVPGATPGNFGVSESGASTYNVPNAVPPGTAGIEPKLSLNYSSHGGNGIAGVGWAIGGQSAITRSPQTIIHDGATRGVQLDSGDRFCIDGQRLIQTTGASYGTVGAEYRTEIESFSKVVSIGGTLGDPQSFQIWTKAGQLIELGNTADSRVEAQGKSLAATWAVNKLSDTVGNYMTFTYFEDNVNGEHRITRVDYTGNVAGDLAPYNAVVFEYETRPDAEVGYVKGSKSQASQRLSKILTYEANNVVKDYGLEYETGAATGKSRLISVTECAGNGDCLNPTTFVWQEGEVGLAITAENTGIADTNALYARAIDVNGDGKTDLVYPSGATWKVRLSQEGGFSSEIDTGIASTGYQYARPVDFNADGRIDMLIPYANGRWYLMRATGNPATPFDPPFDTGIVDGGKAANPQLVDINGDGYPDMVHAHDSFWYSTLGNGTGFGADTKSNMPYVQNGYGFYAF
ncbi:MAG TPA: FG-GAP-like repeat-containing protein, partial [Halomonas sp.]|nr:FG-GAP-like repeat-containing protein [Halomonas sp.]